MHIFRGPPEVRARELLTDCDLPAMDLTSDDFANFLASGPKQNPDGIIALQIFGRVALLRSLAVTPVSRGSGRGTMLVQAVEAYAGERGVDEIYLLTTTAEAFFARLGFSLRDRKTAPDAIRQTREFSGLCPDNAAFMGKSLDRSRQSNTSRNG